MVAILKSLPPVNEKRVECEERLYAALTYLDHHVTSVIKEWDRVVHAMTYLCMP